MCYHKNCEEKVIYELQPGCNCFKKPYKTPLCLWHGFLYTNWSLVSYKCASCKTKFIVKRIEVKAVVKDDQPQ